MAVRNAGPMAGAQTPGSAISPPEIIGPQCPHDGKGRAVEQGHQG